MKTDIGNLHKILCGVALLLVAAQIAVYFYVLGPEQKKVKKEFSSLTSSKSLLRKNNWPANIGVLTAIKNDYKEKLEGDDEDNKSIAALYDMAMKKAGASFLAKIEKEYSSLHEFRRNASRLDYQAEHNRVFSDIAKRGFVLDPNAVGVDENSSSSYIYQLMLQLWTLEKVLNLAADAGLSLQTQGAIPKQARGRSSRDSSGNENQSSVVVHPMKAYMVKSSPTPYLAEFPVSLKLKGTLSSLMVFLKSLQGDDVFLPVSSFEIFALPPSKNNAGSNGNQQSENMYFNLVCSSFLPLPK